jgi:hypothetical protein
MRPRGHGIFELVGLYDDHAQMAYVLKANPLSGKSTEDLKLLVDLGGNFEVEQTPDGLLLRDPFLNGIMIGKAVAIDAKGNRVDVEMVGDGSGITLVVPGAWLAEAAYPVVVDPTIIPWPHSAVNQSDAYIAYDYNPITRTSVNNRAMVVRQRDLAGGDFQPGWPRSGHNRCRVSGRLCAQWQPLCSPHQCQHRRLHRQRVWCGSHGRWHAAGRRHRCHHRAQHCDLEYHRRSPQL